MLFGKRERRIRRILIVEDEPLVAFDNEYMLKDAGYEIVATVDNFAEPRRRRWRARRSISSSPTSASPARATASTSRARPRRRTSRCCWSPAIASRRRRAWPWAACRSPIPSACCSRRSTRSTTISRAGAVKKLPDQLILYTGRHPDEARDPAAPPARAGSARSPSSPRAGARRTGRHRRRSAPPPLRIRSWSSCSPHRAAPPARPPMRRSTSFPGPERGRDQPAGDLLGQPRLARHARPAGQYRAAAGLRAAPDSDEVYTPQAVVQGAVALVGGRTGAIHRAIDEAAARPGPALRVESQGRRAACSALDGVAARPAEIHLLALRGACPGRDRAWREWRPRRSITSTSSSARRWSAPGAAARCACRSPLAHLRVPGADRYAIVVQEPNAGRYWRRGFC